MGGGDLVCALEPVDTKDTKDREEHVLVLRGTTR